MNPRADARRWQEKHLGTVTARGEAAAAAVRGGAGEDEAREGGG